MAYPQERMWRILTLGAWLALTGRQGPSGVRGFVFHSSHRLEERYQPSARKVHQVIGDTRADLEEQREEMIASGQADENDLFIFRLIVSPRPR
jgi:hypothetical protein